MKQFKFEYNGSKEFAEKLSEFKTQCSDTEKRVFQIYTEDLDPKKIAEVSNTVESVFPDDLYFGCSTSGNIVDCQLAGTISVVCTVFERETTRIRLFQYDTSKMSVDEITADIVEQTRQNPWVKGIEMYFTIPEYSTTQFCAGLKEVAPDVQIFGAVACSDDITSDDSCVFSKGKGYSEKSILIVFYGGEDYYVESINLTGWKPLGRKFIVTKSNGSVLHELDGVPAYRVYKKYLNIKNDENFFYNTLEFPLLYEHNDTTILRTPVSSNADDSITMSSDIDVGSVVRVSYGDPVTIVESIKQDSLKIAEFRPDIIHIFSCAARRAFWGDKEPTFEIYPLSGIAPTAGFFSHGEFIRAKENLNQHNVTLVFAAMREGRKRNSEVKTVPMDENLQSKVPVVSRMATFVSVVAQELEETNQKLEMMNEKLKVAAIVDGLTGLYNRKEIQSQISKSLEKVKEEKFSLIMLDIDNFKQVNDTFGHQEGDNVIIALANILNGKDKAYAGSSSAGRWGGEEFMMLLHNTDVSSAALIADLIRQCFAHISFPLARKQTISIGVTQAKADDTVDGLCTRVDTALYEAKKTGKNKVIVF
ncbi:MAG: GGDEF domain-containing protein [Ruminiclostridium sp.]|nr:GGDEF domain-containing protein [Ruminiclostridium sp.]